jgi:hypothetical protein
MALLQEFRSAGEDWFDYEGGLKNDDFPAYVRWLQDGAQGIVQGDMVPWTALWLLNTSSQTLLGVSSLRHVLTLTWNIRAATWLHHSSNGAWQRPRHMDFSGDLKEAKVLGLNRVLMACERVIILRSAYYSKKWRQVGKGIHT